jgi:hypothetical protein
MTKRTKKVGITGKYGTRYGASLRKQVKKMGVRFLTSTAIDHPARPLRLPILRKERCQARGCRYVDITTACLGLVGGT